MQFRIERLVDRAVHAATDRFHLLDDFSDALGQLIRIPLKRQASGLKFKCDAQLTECPHAFEVGIHHERAALRKDLKQTFRLQLEQGRPYRRFGYAVQLRNLVFGEPLAEGERA